MISPGEQGVPPRAPIRETVLHHADDRRVDPYYWMRDRDDPDVLAYLEAENTYTAAMLDHLGPLRDTLYDEIVSRVQETDASAPVRNGPYEYFTRTIEGQQYDVHCRRPAGTVGLPEPSAAPGASPGEEVVLDENTLATGHEFFTIGDLEMSPSHDIVAFTVDTDGGERHELRFRDAARDVALPDVVPDVYYGLAFANDDRTVLYVRPDEAMRPFQVWRHTIGTRADDDALVYQEDDERYFVAVDRSRSGRVLILTSASKVTTEVRLLDADDPTTAAVVVSPRERGHEYHVEHHDGPAGERLFVLSNAGGENFGLYVTPRATPGREHWTPVIAPRVDVRLENVDAFADRVVVSERADAHEQLRVLDLTDDGAVGDDHVIAPPDPVGSMWLGSNPDWDPASLRYGYTSMVVPPSAFDYDPAARTATLVKQQPVPGYDPERYETERRWANAPDGTRVPISLVWRRDVGPLDHAPMLLYGYGAYEVSIDPMFSTSRVSLLDRGVAYAIAHVRGGGELGRAWYEQGKLLAKPNTFTDFVACARHLVDVGVTAPDRLVARGGSAGGLLMGAVANLAPELFRAIVAEVPFVDTLTTMLDESLPLTVTEWDEWGDPSTDPAVYDAMKGYSPYDNVAAKDYPAMLVTAGLNDPRVQYWEPAKWVAKLRATKSDGNVVVLKTELGAGHHGPSGRYDTWRQESFVLAFVLDQVGAGT